jgi:hypothetical protein
MDLSKLTQVLSASQYLYLNLNRIYIMLFWVTTSYIMLIATNVLEEPAASIFMAEVSTYSIQQWQRNRT